MFQVQEVQKEAGMFSYSSRLVNDGTLGELDMHNAGEMF